MLVVGQPVDVRDLFAPERRALLELLEELSDADWFRPTVCAPWTVHDLALHLLAVDVQLISGNRDHFGGSPNAKPVGDLTDWDTLVDYINNRNIIWVEAMQRMSPRLVRELLSFTGEQIVKFLPTIDMDAPGVPVSWAGLDPAPAWLHIAREYTERWVHQQHIRDAVGHAGFTEPEYFHPVLDAFARALPYTLRDSQPADGTAVRLVITGPAGGGWTAAHERGHWNLTDDWSEPAAATVTIDQERAWRLFTKGIDADDVRDNIEIQGDDNLAAPIAKMVSIMA